MPHGTAQGRLRKSIVFALLKKLGDNYCFQCGAEIEQEKDLSIEHKEPWLDSEEPIKKFFDLENIAFSHLKCNIGAARFTRPRMSVDSPTLKHGTDYAYDIVGCRCQKCKDRKKIRNSKRNIARNTIE